MIFKQVGESLTFRKEINLEEFERLTYKYFPNITFIAVDSYRKEVNKFLGKTITVEKIYKRNGKEEFYSFKESSHVIIPEFFREHGSKRIFLFEDD